MATEGERKTKIRSKYDFHMVLSLPRSPFCVCLQINESEKGTQIAVNTLFPT